MPAGYEYGFRNKLDVVHTRKEDWEEPSFDISGEIRSINRLKLNLPVIQSEGLIEPLWGQEGPVLVLRKSWRQERLLAIINKDWHKDQKACIESLPLQTGLETGTLLWPPGENASQFSSFQRRLDPCEIVLIHGRSVRSSRKGPPTKAGRRLPRQPCP